MRTFVLTRLTCMERFSWPQRWLGLVPKYCNCQERHMHRTNLGAVQTRFAWDAAVAFGGTLFSARDLPDSLDIEQGVFSTFSAGPKTFDLLMAAYARLHGPFPLALGDAIGVLTANEADRKRMMTEASAKYEAKLREALADGFDTDYRSRLCIMTVPLLDLTAPLQATASPA